MNVVVEIQLESLVEFPGFGGFNRILKNRDIIVEDQLSPSQIQCNQPINQPINQQSTQAFNGTTFGDLEDHVALNNERYNLT